MMTSLQRVGYITNTTTIANTKSITTANMPIDTVGIISSTHYPDIGYFANLSFPSISVSYTYII